MEKHMKKSASETPAYGNWVASKFIYVPGLMGLACLGLAFFLPALLILGVLFLVISAYFAYAYYLFAPRGKNVQEQIRSLVTAHLDWDGKGQALDIGCGNGALAFEVARKYPHASVVGIDFWGKSWEYSKDVCECNARLEGVAERAAFQKASASALPFADETFDAAVSNLVFHEVADAADKRHVIREALRVVRKGGRFVFQDLFLSEPMYGSTNDLLAEVRSWGIGQVEFVDTHTAAFIPGALKLPFMVGTIGMLVGTK
jgi:SAM-dependent methyltransferase